jgi:putative chitinase
MLHTMKRPAQAGFSVSRPMNSQPATAVPNARPKDDPCAITALRLMAVCPLLKDGDAAAHAGALEAVRLEAGLITTRRVRHFLAQCAHETGGFARLVESLVYRDPARLCDLFSAVRDVHHARGLIAGGPQAIANCVYAGRLGNGDSRSWDGWNYRGRGYLQITGRANYVAAAKALGLPLDAQPELLAEPKIAAKAAAHFWRVHGIGADADRDDTKAVTAQINPALEGLDSRIAWVGRFRVIYP